MASHRRRSGDLGIRFGDLQPGPLDAITDVAGLRVGHATLIEGDAVRTGVTVVVPPELPLFAGSHRLNGNGEVTGLAWVRESGFLTTPVATTNTHSVGVVRDGLVSARPAGTDWGLPVVGETYDGFLNDIDGMHVRAEHVASALAGASDGAVSEGNVGGGTGMICHGFKGGIGTSSRAADGWMVGVLVQANHGRRPRLRVAGAPVGERIGPERVALPRPGRPEPGAGSIIVVLATDAPLLPHQCERLAQRAALGVGRSGGAGENSSGDFVIAFATGNRGVDGDGSTARVEMLRNDALDPLFYAAIEATEAAIVNALLAAETMTGRDGNTVKALEAELLLDALRA